MSHTLDEVSTSVSLVVIVVILLVTTAASLLSPRGRAKSVVARARRHAAEYLDAGSDVDPAERERTFARLLADERHIDAFPARYRSAARDELTTLIERAHRVHDA